MFALIACECSQTICIEFRRLGVEAFSCDILEQYGNHPEWHVKRDVLEIAFGNAHFTTQIGTEHYVPKWDIVIAHPPCTYLANVQSNMYDVNRFGLGKVRERYKSQAKAIDFFMMFTKLGVPTLIENPVGIMSTCFRPPDQIIQPYFFGDPYTKRTCLWLIDLPKLRIYEWNVVEPLPSIPYHNKKSNSLGAWYNQTSKLPLKERAIARSKTFPGIAKAIATQYTTWLSNKENEI